MTQLEKENIRLFIGDSIRRARLRIDKSPKEVAAHLRITSQAYGKIEHGKCDVSMTRLIEIAQIFKTPVAAFLPAEYPDYLYNLDREKNSLVERANILTSNASIENDLESY